VTATTRHLRGPSGDALSVAGVVLAAGMGARMGGGKVLRPVDGVPMVRRVAVAALASHLDGTTVIVGHEGAAVRRALEGLPLRFVENPRYADGLSTSVHAALGAVGTESDAALFLLADQPFVSAGFIDRLLDEYVARGKAIVRPVFDGTPGNPVLFSARLFPELLRETGDRGGRDVVGRHAEEVALVQIDDPLLCLDVDSPEDYERLAGRMK